jgi:lycopene beta-cyclase
MLNLIKKKVDIIIIGAGLSGLTLANKISEKSKKSILLIEKKKKFTHDKNWCFWNTPKNLFTDRFDTAWDSIKVKVDNNEIIHKTDNIKYLHLKSSTFYRYMTKRLAENKKVKILNGKEINEIIIKNKKNEVIIGKHKYECEYLFDSRNSLIKERNGLFQHFAGYEVVFNKNVLNKKQVTFMDFQSFVNGINFMYILPFTTKKALFESTYFSQKTYSRSKYKNNIIKYLNKNFPNVKYKINFKEQGVLPMFSQNVRQQFNYFPIGIPGNWMKSSTGYSFQNCFFYSDLITRRILNNKKITIKTKKIINFLDEVFCLLIIKNPKALKQFFFYFFKKNNLILIVKFLNGNINFFQLLRVIIILPKKEIFISAFEIIKKKVLSNESY